MRLGLFVFRGSPTPPCPLHRPRYRDKCSTDSSSSRTTLAQRGQARWPVRRRKRGIGVSSGVCMGRRCGKFGTVVALLRCTAQARRARRGFGRLEGRATRICAGPAHRRGHRAAGRLQCQPPHPTPPAKRHSVQRATAPDGHRRQLCSALRVEQQVVVKKSRNRPRRIPPAKPPPWPPPRARPTSTKYARTAAAR